MFPGGESVRVVRSGGRNRDGDRVASSSHLVGGVAVDWSGSSIGGVDGVGRSSSPDSRIVLFCPSGSDIVAGDRVVVRDVHYMVVGRPSPWRFVFTAREAGLVVTCEEVTASGAVGGES